MVVHVIHDDSLYFGGSKEPSAMIQIQAIGGQIDAVITPLTEIFSSIGGVLPSRVFVNYQVFTADQWATHGVTVQHFREQHSS
jgi:phenylpyruvate tautomerase PptA (4-oxalocrotonate tautomerase family)